MEKKTMKFKNLIMLLSCFLIFTSSIGCLSWDFGNGLKFDFKSGKIERKGGLYKGHTYARGTERCAKLKEVCNDLRYIKGCQYQETISKTLIGRKPFKECMCRGVELLILP
tara:strand:- start:876 stop:1208 length:333 start_codon:yes stop_codon:yes gene_type:complete